MNILTFDIEEWFHLLNNDSTKSVNDWDKYESRFYQNMDRILAKLERYDTKSTFFCLRGVAEKFPDVIKRIDDLGYEIGSHSYAHQLVYEQSPKVFEDDLKKSINILENITGKKIKYYRSPGFSITTTTPLVFDILLSMGIEVDCSIFPAQRAHGGMNEFGYNEPVILSSSGNELKEFPISTKPILGQNVIYSGGGYFRLLPFEIINNIMSKSDYVMTYFHPRDFDATQPIIKELSILIKFKSYYGLKRASKKLSKLMEVHDFIDIGTAVENIDWNNVPKINL